MEGAFYGFHHRLTRRRLSTAFHPQTDGQTERQNQVLEHFLRTWADSTQSNWAGQLPLAEYAYMNSMHTAIGTTPFHLMYGYHPEVRYEVGDDSLKGRVPSASERIKQMQLLRDGIAERLLSASEYSAKYYNKKHMPQSYAVGDLVLLSTKNLNLKRPSKKMSHKFMGPFEVLDKVGPQAYRLRLPSTYKIHDVLPVSLLEPYHVRGGEQADTFMQAPELIDDEELWEVEEIIEKAQNKQGVWYQVKWTGWGDEYNQWVADEDMVGARELVEDFAAQAQKRRKPDAEEVADHSEPQGRLRRSKRRRVAAGLVEQHAKTAGIPALAAVANMVGLAHEHAGAEEAEQVE